MAYEKWKAVHQGRSFLIQVACEKVQQNIESCVTNYLNNEYTWYLKLLPRFRGVLMISKVQHRSLYSTTKWEMQSIENQVVGFVCVYSRIHNPLWLWKLEETEKSPALKITPFSLHWIPLIVIVDFRSKFRITWHIVKCGEQQPMCAQQNSDVRSSLQLLTNFLGCKHKLVEYKWHGACRPSTFA